MPCSDVTEVLALELDEGEHLLSYYLNKRTCGRAVGEASLLLERLAGMPVPAITAISADEWESGAMDEVELFLELKHLFALQSGLRALLGMDPAGAEDPVKASRIASDGGKLMFEAELSVDILTERIKSCGRCKGCGSIAKTLAAQ